MVTNDIATLPRRFGFEIPLGFTFVEIDAEWLESNAIRFLNVHFLDVFIDKFRLDSSCIDNCTEKAIFDLDYFGKGQLDVEPTKKESL